MDQSIFNLVENPNDLPSSNENMAELMYREILPTRNVTDSATATTYNGQFGGTNISIQWNQDNRTWWIPSRSYLKLDLEITSPGNGSIPLEKSDLIAPNMGLASSLFNRMQFKMNDTTVSQISQYIPQCDAITNRIYQSQAWLDKNVGNSVNFWEAHHKKRLQEISIDGYYSDYIMGSSSVNSVQSSFFKVSGKIQLGLGDVDNTEPTTGITINFDTRVMTFHSIGGWIVENTDTIFKTGDILVIRLATEAFDRVFVVQEVNADNTLVFYTIGGSGLGGTVGDLGNGLYNITAYQPTTGLLRSINNVDGLITDVANGRNSININNELDSINLVDGNDNDFVDAVVNQYDWLATTEVDDAKKLDLLDLNIIQPGVPPDFELPLANQVKIYRGINPLIRNAAALNTTNPIEIISIGSSYTPVSKLYIGANVDTEFTLFLDGLTNRNYIRKTSLDVATINFNKLAIGDILIIEQRFAFITEVDNTLGNLYVSGSIPLTGIASTSDVSFLKYKEERTSVLSEIDGINIAKGKTKFDVCWRPTCMSIWNYQGAIPGGCKFELELQALAQEYAGLAVETPYGVIKNVRVGATTAGKDFQVLVKNLKLYACVVQGPVVGQNEYSYYLNLNECRAHVRRITDASLTQTSLDITPSSYALALAFQDQRALSKEQTDKSITKFHIVGTESDREELSLTRYSIRFAGISLPQPDAEMKVGEEQEFLNNQFIRNSIYTNQYFKNAGGESLVEWKERGIYFYHPFVRSAGNREVRAYVITQFNQDNDAINKMSAEGLENMKMFLFEFYRAFALIKMKNGSVYSVQTANQ